MKENKATTAGNATQRRFSYKEGHQDRHNYNTEIHALSVIYQCDHAERRGGWINRLTPEFFAYDDAREIFIALRALQKRDKAFDTSSVMAILELRGAGPDGTPPPGDTFGRLIDGGTRESNVEPYLRELADFYERRAYYDALSAAQADISTGQSADAAHARFEETRALIKKRAAQARGTANVSGFYRDFTELERAELPPVEMTFATLPRGQVGMLVAAPDAGKTTLLLNATARLAAGLDFIPLARKPPRSLRVVYVDFEATEAELRADFEMMLAGMPADRAALARANFIPVVDAEIDDEPLCLSNPAHLQYLTRFARECGADLVIIDTVSAGFDLQDENANAEVKRVVMRPLKGAAKNFNGSVLFTHHDPKSDASEKAEPAYRGRGASAYGALSRAIYTLRKEPSRGEGAVTLSQPKGKGGKFAPHLLTLGAGRWFKISDDLPPEIPTAYGLVVEAVTGPMSMAEIIQALAGRLAASTVKERVAYALKRGELLKTGRGIYQPAAKGLGSNG
jgi:KaiC/GvpD/RAD55 family RecA-like ATPase